MTSQRQKDYPNTISRKRTANMRGKIANRMRNLHFVIFDGRVINTDHNLDTANALDESSDDTFDKSAFDILVEADEFLQTRLPQFRDRHPYEQ